ncbi:MAG TPA: hypothetical protein DCZ13_10890 [Porticoccaceae bacterium]|nr:hypothetical protein [Porticoccaceae bacterium]
MNQQTLFDQGFDMMVLGMGTVFAFLITMVLVVVLMSRTISRFAPNVTNVPASGKDNAAQPQQVDALTAKIIKAAIDKHRAR